MAHRSALPFAGLALAVLATVSCATQGGHRDALWHIVHDDCVPAAQAGRPSACVQTDLAQGVDAGDAVLKDRSGVLQYLLIPTARTTGIEDARLLRPGAGAYFADAWRARRWMDRLHGAPIPADDVAVTVNSELARSQDQLHLHVSCVRADLKQRLAALDGRIDARWAPLPGDWRGHAYQVRRIPAPSLDGEDPFHDVADHLSGAAADMGRRGIAVVGAAPSGFWLLESAAAPGSGWLGGVEDDVQDHGCAVLEQAARRPAG